MSHSTNLIADLKLWTCSICSETFQSTHPYPTPTGLDACESCQLDAITDHLEERN
jgi:hypothetical protein